MKILSASSKDLRNSSPQVISSTLTIERTLEPHE